MTSPRMLEDDDRAPRRERLASDLDPRFTGALDRVAGKCVQKQE
jgi:hypothetical protein